MLATHHDRHDSFRYDQMLTYWNEVSTELQVTAGEAGAEPEKMELVGEYSMASGLRGEVAERTGVVGTPMVMSNFWR
jgi:hypothetical protein